MKQFNSDHICSAAINAKLLNTNYKYKEEYRWLGIRWRKEGYYRYSLFSDRCWLTTKEIIEEDGKLYCENKMVYYKPHIIFNMTNKTDFTKYFADQYALNNFVDAHLNTIKWIKL